MTRQNKHLCARVSDRLGHVCRGLIILSMILLSGATMAAAIYCAGSIILKLYAR